MAEWTETNDNNEAEINPTKTGDYSGQRNSGQTWDLDGAIIFGLTVSSSSSWGSDPESVGVEVHFKSGDTARIGASTTPPERGQNVSKNQYTGLTSMFQFNDSFAVEKIECYDGGGGSLNLTWGTFGGSKVGFTDIRDVRKPVFGIFNGQYQQRGDSMISMSPNPTEPSVSINRPTPATTGVIEA